MSRVYKAKTGVGCDGFHSKVPLDLTKETRGEIVEFLEKVEQNRKWPQQACTTMFFLIPKNVKSERPIAFVLTLIRWWEALRAPEVAEWQLKYRVEWDATDGRNGGAQQTVWEILMEMESFDGKAKEGEQRAVALVLDLAKAFERVSLPVVWAWATHISFPRKIFRVLSGYIEHWRRLQFEGCVAEPLKTITAILPGSKWSCLLLRILLQGVFVDHITALVKGVNREVAEAAKKVMKKLKEEIAANT